MSEFKSIITHPEGQNLFPNQITTIEGYPHGTSITMKNTKPQIALTPYGASYMMPDMHYKFAGNTVVELPQAQMGGGDPQQDQLMQVIQMYAQMKQMDPNELIQKIQSLPQEQQQQAIQSIAQEVQQAMAQQQQAQAPEGDMSSQQMMGQNMPQEEMMSHGGEPCIECFDNYNPSPQAQDLNWYYKATGGEAFPQANTYPEDWASYSGNQYAQGGEAFPQAQTYLPNDRPHETRPNFMFQAGGMKEEYGPYKDSAPGGADRTKMTRDQYLALRKQYGDALSKYGQNYMSFDEYDKLTPEQSNLLMHQTYDEQPSTGLWENIQDTGSLIGNSARHLFNKTFDTHFQAGGQSDIDRAYQIMKKGGMDYNPRKKKGGKFNHLDEFQKYLKNEKKGKKFQDGGEQDENYNQMMTSNAYSNMKNTAFFDTLKNTTLDNHWDQPTPDKEKAKLTGPLYDKEDEDMNSVTNPFAEAESQFNDMQKEFGDGEISDNNSNTAENYAKTKKPKGPKLSWDSLEKTTQAGILNGAAAMTGNKGLFGLAAAINNTGRAVKAAGAGWSNPGRAFKNSMMQSGGNTQDPRFVDYDRFPKKNSGFGAFETRKVKTVDPHQKEGRPQKHKRTGPCVDGRCYTSFQEGGPYVYTSPNIDNSYFNPLSGDIYLNEDQSHDPSVFPHEYEHYLQWRDGQFKVLPGQYRYEENLPATLNPNLPLMMPSIARDMDFEGQMPYYNRRPIDQMSATNDFLGENPSFNLVNPQLIYDKVANPEMYENPYAIEGQAQMVGDQYMGPTMQRGGRLPKHQAWLSQTGNLSQPQGAFNTWNVQTPANIQNSSAFQAVQSANQSANKVADQNIVKQGTDKMGDKPSDKSGSGTGFDLQKAMNIGNGLVGGLNQVGDFIGNWKRSADPNKDRERRNTHTSEFMDVAQFGGGQYGDWSTNATQGTSFRPDEMVYAQKAGKPYKDITIHDYPTFEFKDIFSTKDTMQIGGSVLDQYNDDEEYDLTPEEIEQIIAAGGTIEYL